MTADNGIQVRTYVSDILVRSGKIKVLGHSAHARGTRSYISSGKQNPRYLWRRFLLGSAGLFRLRSTLWACEERITYHGCMN
jgi:hypothetical protein